MNIVSLALSDPDFWTPLRLAIIEPVLDKSRKKDIWVRSDIKSIAKEIAGTYQLDISLTEEQTRIVFAYCSDIKLLKLHRFAIPYVKRLRQEAIKLPKRADNVLLHVRNLLEYHWTEWKRIGESQEIKMLSLVMSMAADGGYGRPLLPGAISHLRLSDVTIDKSIVVPLSAKHAVTYCCELQLPPASKLILASSIRGRATQSPSTYVYLPEITEYSSREDAVTKSLIESYAIFCNDYSSDRGESSLLTLFDFLKVANALSLKKHIPPYMLTLLSRTPLPATGIWDNYHSVYKREYAKYSKIANNRAIKFNADPFDGQNTSTTISSSTNTPSEPSSSTRKITHINWTDYTYKALKDFCSDLHKAGIAKLKRANSEDKERIIENVRALTEFHLSIIDDSIESGSALHLAIQCGTHYVTHGRVRSINTLWLYYSRVFISGIFPHARFVPFKSLTSQQHIQMYKNKVNSLHARTKSLDQLIDAWSRVYRYASDNGYTSHNIAIQLMGSMHLSRRFGLVWPDHFSQVLSFIEKYDNHPVAPQLSMIIGTLYYTGLRGEECVSLLMSDVTIKGSLVEIKVKDGKTGNAARSIILNAFATKIFIAKFIAYYNGRLKSTPGKKDGIYLFGPPGDPLCWNDAIDRVNDALKHIFGAWFVPHILRHCFISITILRLAVLDYPEIIKTIPASEKGNELFSAESLTALRHWYLGVSDSLIIGSDNSAFWHGAKVFGHASPSEGHYTYSHVLPYIQRGIYARSISNYPGPIIGRNAARVFLPNARSSRTLARKYREGMTVSDILDEAWRNI